MIFCEWRFPRPVVMETNWLSKLQIDSIRRIIVTNHKYTSERGCWLKSQDKDKNYPNVRFLGKSIGLHKLSAILYLGHIFNSSAFICHKCDVKGCFNPDHLYIGTNSDNWNDYLERKRGVETCRLVLLRTKTLKKKSPRSNETRFNQTKV